MTTSLSPLYSVPSLSTNTLYRPFFSNLILATSAPAFGKPPYLSLSSAVYRSPLRTSTVLALSSIGFVVTRRVGSIRANVSTNSLALRAALAQKGGGEGGRDVTLCQDKKKPLSCNYDGVIGEDLRAAQPVVLYEDAVGEVSAVEDEVAAFGRHGPPMQPKKDQLMCV